MDELIKEEYPQRLQNLFTDKTNSEDNPITLSVIPPCIAGSMTPSSSNII